MEKFTKEKNKFKHVEINDRIYFSDFDNTIKSEDIEHNSDETLKQFQNLKQAGAITCLITGRPFMAFAKKASDEMLTAFDYISTDNGSMIFKVTKDLHLELIYANKMKKIDVDIIENYIGKKKIACVVNTTKGLYKISGKKIENLDILKGIEGITIQELIDIEDEYILQFNIAGSNNSIKGVEHLESNWSSKFNTYAVEGGKQNAVRIIKNIYPEKATFAFGDAENDIPMFLNVDYSYALKNACDELKELASKTLKFDVKNNAVAYELEKIYNATVKDS